MNKWLKNRFPCYYLSGDHLHYEFALWICIMNFYPVPFYEGQNRDSCEFEWEERKMLCKWHILSQFHAQILHADTRGRSLGLWWWGQIHPRAVPERWHSARQYVFSQSCAEGYQVRGTSRHAFSCLQNLFSVLSIKKTVHLMHPCFNLIVYEIWNKYCLQNAASHFFLYPPFIWPKEKSGWKRKAEDFVLKYMGKECFALGKWNKLQI